MVSTACIFLSQICKSEFNLFSLSQKLNKMKFYTAIYPNLLDTSMYNTAYIYTLKVDFTKQQICLFVVNM